MQMWNLFSSFHVVCVPHKTAAVAHSMPEVSGECQHVSLHFLLTITNYTCQVNILFSFRSPNNKLSRGKSSSSCLSPPHLELSHSRWSDECGFRRWSEKKVDKSSEMLLMMSSQAFGTSSGFCTHKKKREFHIFISFFLLFSPPSSSFAFCNQSYWLSGLWDNPRIFSFSISAAPSSLRRRWCQMEKNYFVTQTYTTKTERQKSWLCVLLCCVLPPGRCRSEQQEKWWKI